MSLVLINAGTLFNNYVGQKKLKYESCDTIIISEHIRHLNDLYLQDLATHTKTI